MTGTTAPKYEAFAGSGLFEQPDDLHACLLLSLVGWLATVVVVVSAFVALGVRLRGHRAVE